jgi:hypothetical protein
MVGRARSADHDFRHASKPKQPNKPKLDDAETIILMASVNKEDGIALHVPDRIKAPADQIARKIRRLTKLSLLQEVPAKLEDELWRKTVDDRHLTLKISRWPLNRSASKFPRS